MDDSIYETDDIQATQSTQSTQPASQVDELPSTDQCLWGYLQPLVQDLPRFDFRRSRTRYTFGRDTTNDCLLVSPRISGIHCIISWDGTQSDTSVMIQDLSKNGTMLRGVNILKETRILYDGSEIGFPSIPSDNRDFRFIYRHTAYPPKTIMEDDYQIMKILGHGSYGVVRKALSIRDGKSVAIKTIRESRSIQSPSEQIVRPTMREIEILQKLVHENICQLIAVYYQDSPFEVHLVLELVENGDLFGYLMASGEPIPLEKTQSITHQICKALAYIHSKNVTHRDLKPENILMVSREPPKIKVADFGLAKFVDNGTMLRTMCGTLSYLAPEVVTQTNRGYDNLVDSWSVGVIVFAMLAKKNPFEENSTLAPIVRVQQRTIRWDYLAYIDYAAVDFVQRLLDIDPSQRMSLTDALEHTWLNMDIPTFSYGTGNPSIATPRSSDANPRFPPFDLPSGSSIPGLNASKLQGPSERVDTPVTHGDENVVPQPSPEPSVASTGSQDDLYTDLKDVADLSTSSQREDPEERT